MTCFKTGLCFLNNKKKKSDLKQAQVIWEASFLDSLRWSLYSCQLCRKLQRKPHTMLQPTTSSPESNFEASKQATFQLDKHDVLKLQMLVQQKYYKKFRTLINHLKPKDNFGRNLFFPNTFIWFKRSSSSCCCFLFMASSFCLWSSSSSR